jgi:hypothetical protein
MKIDIFYKSYEKDFKWLYLSLESLKKNITGYNEVIIVIPEHDKKHFDWNFVLPERTYIHTINEPKKAHPYGYLFQQYVKMIAHRYSSANYIMYSDSDCIFNTKKNIKEFVDNEGKTTILYTDYSKVGDAICWKEPTEKALSMPIHYEFMRRNCMVYRRDSLLNLEVHLNRNLQKYITNQPSFSEFNVMGAYCCYFERDKYNFINTDNWKFEESFFKQYWSWSDLKAEELTEIKSILNEN